MTAHTAVYVHSLILHYISKCFCSFLLFFKASHTAMHFAEWHSQARYLEVATRHVCRSEEPHPQPLAAWHWRGSGSDSCTLCRTGAGGRGRRGSGSRICTRTGGGRGTDLRMKGSRLISRVHHDCWPPRWTVDANGHRVGLHEAGRRPALLIFLLTPILL